jgi:phosphatidylinositol dimannoside acyltransferase
MKTYYLLKIASTLSKFIPARVGYWLCSLVGGVVFYFMPSTRRAVMDNLRHVLPGSTRHVRRNIARKTIRNTFKNYYDVVRLPHLKVADIERMVASLEGLEHLENVYSQGRGVIVIGAHIGNFNLVAQLTVARGYRVTYVAEDVKPEKLFNYINYLRASLGLKFIKMGSSQVRTIYRFLRDGSVLLLAVDRDVTEAGLPVRFFDAVADLPAGPVELAMRLKIPLVPAVTYRLPDSKNVVIIRPPIELERTGDNERDIQANLRKVAQVLEEFISKAPDQWTVLQKVWDRDYTEENEGSGTRDQGSGTGNEQIEANLQQEEALSPSLVADH